MSQQCEQMIRLVDDLLDASRITQGKIELRLKTVDLATIVANAVQTSRLLNDQSNHRLAISLPQNPVTFVGDPARLTQVVVNLLCNAAKYTPRGGQIWLTGHRVDNGIEISVRDTGVGISEDMLLNVFDMFTQVETSKSRSHGGLGLGLALSKKLVELHGGTISVKSPGVGQGSEFVLWLPITNTQELVTYTPLSPSVAEQVTTPPRQILVVDDSNSAAFILSSLLKKLGHDVDTAHSGISALEKVKKRKPDYVFSDIAMPDIDGYEMVRLMKAIPHMANTVMVALTGYGHDEDRRQSFEAGFDFHLVKPVSLESLSEVLSAVSAVSRNV
jgi:CheY-like chemotaxis protein